MGSSPDKPQYRQPSIKNLDNGSDMLAQIQGWMKNGLDKDELDIYTRQGRGLIDDTVRQSRDAVDELMMKNYGSTPLGFKAKATADIYGNRAKALTDLQDKLAMAKKEGKRAAYDTYAKMYQLALGEAGGGNQYNLDMYKTELENSFGWEDLLIGLLEGGSKVGSALISKK